MALGQLGADLFKRDGGLRRRLGRCSFQWSGSLLGSGGGLFDCGGSLLSGGSSFLGWGHDDLLKNFPACQSARTAPIRTTPPMCCHPHCWEFSATVSPSLGLPCSCDVLDGAVAFAHGRRTLSTPFSSPMAGCPILPGGWRVDDATGRPLAY